MPDTQYPPIPAHIYAIACALVKTKRDEESPVVIRVEEIPSLHLLSCPVPPDAPFTVYPVTFVSTYTAHDAGRDGITRGMISRQNFDGWNCLHSIIAEPGDTVECVQTLGDADNA